MCVCVGGGGRGLGAFLFKWNGGGVLKDSLIFKEGPEKNKAKSLQPRA